MPGKRIEVSHVHTKEGTYPPIALPFSKRVEEIKRLKIDKVHIADKVHFKENIKKKFSIYERFRGEAGEYKSRFSFGFEIIDVLFAPEKRYVEIYGCDLQDLSLWKKHPRTLESVCELIEKSGGILVLPHPFSFSSVKESGTEYIVKRLGYMPAIEINYAIYAMNRVLPRLSQLNFNLKAHKLAEKYNLPKVYGLDGFEEPLYAALNIFPDSSLREAVRNDSITPYFSSVNPKITFKRLARTLHDIIYAKVTGSSKSH
jgi:predicted metal-dependent phosphoesterase TrpH